MYGQSSSSLPSAPGEPPLSRVDIFLGYSYAAPKATVETPLGDGSYFAQRPSAVDAGALASGAYFFNRYVGGQFEYGNHQNGKNDGFQTAQAGIIFRFPVASDDIIPFIHGLAGATRFGGPNNDAPGDSPGTFHNYQWGPALTAGGGLDYGLPWFNHRLALRLFQADYEYFHVNWGPQAISGGRLNANVARLSTGLVFKFGDIVPPPPVAYACSASPSSVFPGEPVTITGTATNLNPKKTATYSWTGEGASGANSTATVETGSLAPGSYTVTGHVTEGSKAGQSADCTAQFTVKQFEPPTVSCVANPSSVNPGDSSTVTATGVSPQNRPLTYSYQASAGSISGTSTTATLSTTGAPAGEITVTCNVADDKGQTASATTTVTVAAPPAPAPKTQTLCSFQFDHDKRRPARVDNDAKGCLDDVALNLQRSSDATLVVVGNSAPVPEMHGRHRRHEMSAADLAAQRAVNTKGYLVTEKGIDASRISVRTGSSGANEVQDYLVPAGANFDSDVPGTTAVDESMVKPQERKPLGERHHPVHHHHKKAAAATSGN
jgi:outer membrane protein OmpA-like peptidoglycan-associated protein